MVKNKPLIAVVDDDRSVVKSLARLLRLAGYEVGAFASAMEFIGSIPAAIPQCLVLDVHMPEMNGLELESRLRQLGHQVPIIFITANDTPQLRQQARQTGSLGLLFKPFGNTALLDLVHKAIEGPGASCGSSDPARH